MKVAVDTTYILGRGAVKDTYNLLADGIVQVVRALAQLDGARAEEWALSTVYFGSSVKRQTTRRSGKPAEDSSRCRLGIGIREISRR